MRGSSTAVVAFEVAVANNAANANNKVLIFIFVYFGD